MELQLKRRWLTERATVGELFIGGVFFGFTLENKYRPPPEPKVPGETCIPCGHYEVLVTHSPRFGVDMPLLLNVPGFVGVRIHVGNTPSDTEGCILVGQSHDGEKLTHSREAYEALFARIQAARARGELVFIGVTVEPQQRSRTMPDAPASPEAVTQPVEPPKSFLAALLAFLSSGTARRLGVFLLGLAAPLLNKRFGWDLDATAIAADVALVLGYIVQSAGNEAIQAHADAKVAAAQAMAAKAPGVASAG